jgi:hypothetical protein
LVFNKKFHPRFGANPRSACRALQGNIALDLKISTNFGLFAIPSPTEVRRGPAGFVGREAGPILGITV